ncbi:GNAT family N-acetyltransferase [Gorillibacterium timonense]|uniref:GNAT family N-acetyltransferase n=1 Tax=Gorillibacterium timonense TaxID=1689269 RepID=UPI00071D7989|nr:GNAT family N-acetyltransferase [Gorillibacterium timonense]
MNLNPNPFPQNAASSAPLIRRMVEEDIEPMEAAFAAYGIRKPAVYLRRCWDENQSASRTTLLAFVGDQFAGSLHLLAQSDYPFFADQRIPEINDFNVIPPYRRQGVGNTLMEAIEALAFQEHGTVGIGVGLYASYGNAQRMYARRGYIPDGRGITYENRLVEPGSQVPVDDELVLYMTKARAPKNSDRDSSK